MKIDKTADTNRFHLKGQTKEFTARQNDLFNVLDSLETKANKSSHMDDDDAAAEETEQNHLRDTTVNKYLEEVKQTSYVGRKSFHNNNKETRTLRGKESIFKRPEAPISKCLPLGRIPGFRKNPQNWTKYTLNDVEEMSDKSNAAAAMSFLKELQERNNTSSIHGDDDMHVDVDDKKIIFSKTALIKQSSCSSGSAAAVGDDDNNGKPMFLSSKVIMPEYAVGQKKNKSTENKERKNYKRGGCTKQLKLDHLIEEENDDDDVI